jgi:hypothetical protein
MNEMFSVIIYDAHFALCSWQVCLFRNASLTQGNLYFVQYLDLVLTVISITDHNR